MGTKFRVLGRDGSEAGPVNVETLHQWFREGKIAPDLLVSEARTLNWRRLDEVFDLSTWTLPVGAPSESSLRPDFTAKAPARVVSDDNFRTSGMFAAAILLFLSALISVVELILSMGFASHSVGQMIGAFRWTSAVVMDIVIGVGLLRGRWQWRVVAMIRAAIGLPFVIWWAALEQNPSSWIVVVFQIVFLAGMLLLLYGKPPSRERVFAGVVTVVLSWFGSAGAVLVDRYFGYDDYPPPAEASNFEASEHPRYAGGMKIDDQLLGYQLDLPYEWSVIENMGEPWQRDAEVLAMNYEDGCWMSLHVEVIPSGISSLDHYLNVLLADRTERMPSTTETGRVATSVGGREARRLELKFEDRGERKRGFTTVCSYNDSYYVLSGWCDAEAYKKASLAFSVLEQRLQVTGAKPGVDVETQTVDPKSRAKR
jgi:hypothetical protein